MQRNGYRRSDDLVSRPGSGPLERIIRRYIIIVRRAADAPDAHQHDRPVRHERVRGHSPPDPAERQRDVEYGPAEGEEGRFHEPQR